MDAIRQHVQKNGKKVGEWVDCKAPTQDKCRNGGTHAEQYELNNAAEQYKQVTGVTLEPNQLPPQFVETYQALQKRANIAATTNTKTFNARNKEFLLNDETEIPQSGIVYEQDAIYLENIFAQIENEILNNPTPSHRQTLPSKVMDSIGGSLHKIKGLNREQRLLVLDMISDAAAGCYLTVHRRTYPNGDMGISIQQRVSSDITLAWLRVLRTHIATKANKRSFTAAFEVVESFYNKK